MKRLLGLPETLGLDIDGRLLGGREAADRDSQHGNPYSAGRTNRIATGLLRPRRYPLHQA